MDDEEVVVAGIEVIPVDPVADEDDPVAEEDDTVAVPTLYRSRRFPAPQYS